MQDGDQIFVLDTESLEKSYPTPWKQSVSEAKAMSGKTKLELAVSVGDNISKEQIAFKMPTVYGALQKA